ncbi:MAG TPA: PQQ-dependent sugar dehydrogenase [Propionicimonas sp.]|nr:PQQ-dependent sugar dehydrogenase [Propionicimonas sp.]HQA78409.1 PQQ-dependent sugar dehydrogenase [Propionicimonas sp.]HQD96035.1 PQQ-dependent sugar dehydrogenase [Propionicimonas sp.]
MSRIVVALLAGVLLCGCTSGVSTGSTGGVGGSTSGTEVSTSPDATGSAPASAARRVLATKLDVPWDFVRLPDESVLITLRDRGELVRLASSGELQTVAKVDGVRPGGEGGLLGIALSPAFASDQLLYLYYTAAADNRVVRYRYDGGLADSRPIVTGIPKAGNHNGGRLRFGPDGNLYIGTGDAGNTRNSQDRDSLGGKILRVHPDGSIPDDNPFGNAVYSYGHRNVQGLGWDASGRLYASEFGQNAYDELNLIKAGANYGWPQTEGATNASGVTAPLLVWTTDEASPSGIAVTPVGEIYLAALRGERVWHSRLTSNGLSEPDVFLRDLGRIRAVEAVGDQLWVLTNNTARGNPGADDDQLVAVPLGT